jgi:hypothetical protein
VTRWQRDELVEARADAILAGPRTGEAYAAHFDAELREVRSRAWGYRGLAVLLRILHWPWSWQGKRRLRKERDHPWPMATERRRRRGYAPEN